MRTILRFIGWLFSNDATSTIDGSLKKRFLGLSGEEKVLYFAMRGTSKEDRDYNNG